MRMFDFLPVAMHHHHARIFSLRQRMLRNQFPGQLVIVIIQPRTHAFIIKGFDRARKDDIISPCFSPRFLSFSKR